MAQTVGGLTLETSRLTPRQGMLRHSDASPGPWCSSMETVVHAVECVATGQAIAHPMEPLAETLLFQAVRCPDMTIIHVIDVQRYLKRIINTPKCLPCLELYFGRLSNPKIIPLKVSKYRNSEFFQLSGCQWDIISCSEHILFSKNKIKETFFLSYFKSHSDYGC